MPVICDYSRHILEQVASGKRVSQRSIARDTGIALGLANLLIRRMTTQGWIRMVRTRANRVDYLITPAGLAEKSRRSRIHLAGNVLAYAEARDRIAQRLSTLSVQWRCQGTGAIDKRVVFCGAGEMAEIGFICLQATDLHLVGVVDHGSRTQFFGYQVQPFTALSPGRLAGEPFGRLVVMCCSDEPAMGDQLAARGFSPSDVFWI